VKDVSWLRIERLGRVATTKKGINNNVCLLNDDLFSPVVVDTYLKMGERNRH
jgi:hypothetical protein